MVSTPSYLSKTSMAGILKAKIAFINPGEVENKDSEVCPNV